MVNPIEALSVNTTVSSNFPNRSAAETPEPDKAVGDSIAISSISHSLSTELHNRNMVRESWEKHPDADKPKWTLSSGLKEGKTTLKNGDTQTVSIDGDKLEILQFREGRLVKSVEGTVAEGNIILDTKFYDSQGKVSQSIHTELVEGRTIDGWSSARMSRNVEWFDGERLMRTMNDEMMLQSKHLTATPEGLGGDGQLASFINSATSEMDVDADLRPKSLSQEHHIARYFGNIQEFGDNSRLKRDITMTLKGEFGQVTNRHGEKLQGMEPGTTAEVSHDTGLSVQIRDYDENGNLIRDASLSDTQKDDTKENGGKLRQTLSVSWYDDGELVKRSNGSFSMNETLSAKLSSRPGILDMLGLEEEQYATPEYKDAMKMLATGVMDAGAKPDNFMAGLHEKIGDGEYRDVESLSKKLKPDRAYDMNWTDELYADGELIAKQKDTERVVESYKRDPFAKGIHFGTGKGLKEGDNPQFLRQTTHELESYEEGELKSQRIMQSRESMRMQRGEADKLMTSTLVTEKVNDRQASQGLLVEGGLDVIDDRANSASKGFATEFELTMDGLYDVIGSLNGEEETRTKGGFKPRFDFGDT